MQDLHAIGGGAGGGGGGRFFGGGDRRLRPHNHSNHQALKCPRCDSLNTKFCYYNNYNLSQPRHFCKSCRRYWTKGGVLRNVPVGGGCRKTKRSKHKTTAGAPTSADAPRERSSNVQSSSSDSSSLTAATPTSATATAAAAVAEEGSAPSKTTSIYPFSDARFFNGNSNLDHQPMANQSSSENQIFAPDIGGFASMMASSGDMNMLGFGMADIPTTSYGRSEQGNQATEFKMQEMSSDGLAAAALDWGSGGGGGGGGGGGEGDQGMYDLTAAVDPAYWSQPQWNDNDQSLNFLP